MSENLALSGVAGFVARRSNRGLEDLLGRNLSVW